MPSQLNPDQWALFAGTTLRRDCIVLRSKSFPSKQLNMSVIQKGKPRIFECRGCGSKDHLWAACPKVEIFVKDPEVKKCLLASIPSGNIHILSSGEDKLADPTNDDSTTVVDNTTATDNTAGPDPMEDCDTFEDDFIHDDTAFENAFDEGIIMSLEHEYLDKEFNGTIGAEFLGDIPSSNAFVATSIPFEEVFPDVQLESGEDVFCPYLSALLIFWPFCGQMSIAQY